MGIDTSALDPLLDGVLRHWPIGGGVVVVVTPDDDVIRPFGSSDPRTGTPVSVSERFEIGSISKIFTSLLINQLIDEGRLSLDSPVADLLPTFTLPGSASRATVRHLLHHTAGLISGSDAVPDALAQCWSLRDTSAITAPGEFFHYSNVGFILLGCIVEELTESTLARAMDERVLRPAGMHDSLAEVTHGDRGSLAIGQAPLRDDAPWIPGDPLVPATWLEVAAGDGNVASTAQDMARFLRMLLGAGSLDGRAVVSPESFARVVGTLAPGGEDTLTVGRHRPVRSSRYGLGINVEQISGGTVLTHGGGMVGYASFLLADLASGMGVAVLTNANGDTPIAELIARDVHASCGPGDSALLAPRQLDPSVWPGDPELAGRFSSSHGEIELGYTPHRELVLSSGGTSGRVFWTLGNRFACEHPDFRLSHLGFERRGGVGVWTCGPRVFYSEVPVEVPDRVEFGPLAGHYRSYSPWFTNFRVFQREGKLLMAAASGVEAPSEEVSLIPLEDGTFRCGDDPRLAERMRFGPVVDGTAIWAEKDGCRYSRTFTP